MEYILDVTCEQNTLKMTMKKARIYNPPKSAMQSGKANTKKWILEFIPQNGRFVDPVMGWTGSTDMHANEVKMKFLSKEDAETYAKGMGLEYEIIEPKHAQPKVRAYSDNYKFDCN